MDIEKIKKEQEFEKKVVSVFENVLNIKTTFLNNTDNPVINLFAAFYSKDRGKAFLLFTESEKNTIREYVDKMAEKLINQPYSDKMNDPIIPFPYILLNDQSTDYTILTNEQEFYKRLLKTFIDYKKSLHQFWSETDMYNLLIEKNKKYGDAVLNPVRILSSNIGIKDVILSRIDEKLSRLMQDHKNEDEDIINDIIGYLIFINILLLD